MEHVLTLPEAAILSLLAVIGIGLIATRQNRSSEKGGVEQCPESDCNQKAHRVGPDGRLYCGLHAEAQWRSVSTGYNKSRDGP